MSARKKKVSSEQLRKRLKIKHLKVQKNLKKKHPHVDKLFKEKGLEPGKVREHSTKILGAGVLTGTLLLAPPGTTKSLPAPHEIVGKIKGEWLTTSLDVPQEILVDSLAQILPGKTRPLGRSEEKQLEQLFENIIGVKAKATLQGEHLNTVYGKIGIEQHLKRFPGDTISQHGSGSILRQGIAPGLGAWGYFASSKDKLTPELVETEKWYAVVQTLYLPDWNRRVRYLGDWYKYRKVLIVNCKNGNALVAAIADSGPAAWTGKHFGGSPEVMNYLGGPRYTKGPVIVFFVDDPENKVALGPVEYNKIDLLKIKVERT